jgi:hypothetical protein
MIVAKADRRGDKERRSAGSTQVHRNQFMTGLGRSPSEA